MSINNPHSLANFLSSGWRGYFDLTTALWRYYLVGRIIAYGVGWLLATYLGFLGWFVGTMIWSTYWLWSLLTLWRCAWNTEHAVLFYLVRALVLIDVLYAFARPPLFEFADF